MSSISMSRFAIFLFVLLSWVAPAARGQTAESTEPDAKPGERISTTVRIRNDGSPIPLQTTRSNNIIKVSFATKTGKKYIVYSTKDLTRWIMRADLVDGTGGNITVSFDAAQDILNFIRVREISITPIANMVWIGPGKFTMGSPLSEQDRDLDEDPLTEVTLTRGMWMGKYEVTQREYEEIIGTNPSWFRGNSSLPVEQVAWKEAVAYCTRLTERERQAGNLPSSYAYRLPTEAEFEYAARAGTSTRFSFGDDPDYSKLGDYAWYLSNGSRTTHPVGQKTPNAFGLYDIYGNVWEWCLDWYADFYPGGKVEDPTGPATGAARVFRGGGWDYVAYSCRSAYRNNVSPVRRARAVGFRVVLAPVLP
jgi:formylglycine-generating enzyme required for sulfatase activity